MPTLNPSIPPVIAAFLASIAAKQQSSPSAATTSSLLLRNKKQLLAVAALVAVGGGAAGPWLRTKLEQSRFYQEHRRRQASFAQHLKVADDKAAAEEDGQVAKKTAIATKKQQQQQKVGVDREFVRRLAVLMRILVPRFRSKETAMIFMHGFFLVLRTYLSVVVARIDGLIVKELVAGNKRGFVTGLGWWFAIAIPATYTNSMIRYLQSKLAIAFRTRLTNHVHDAYLADMTYYRLLNLDSRVAGPDQLICTDVARFCDTLASLYSNLAKPILDMAIFNYQLYQSIGGAGMAAITVNYVITASILRRVTPAFGKLAAVEAKLEGDFRSSHTRLITNAEEIAFYHGGERELSIVNDTYKTLIRHVNRIYRIRIFYNMFEDFIIKYAWSAVGLLVASVPVFFPHLAGVRTRIEATTAAAAAASGKDDGGVAAHGSRTQGFITNKRLMISLADAGGRIMYSYKELAELAGYTSRVYELLEVFADLKQRRYQKMMLSATTFTTTDTSPNGSTPTSPTKQRFSLNDVTGQMRFGADAVKLEHVPIVTPSGDLLVDDISCDVRPGMHVLVAGPNGTGKSSLMRIVSGLWPLFRGVVERPFDRAMIFIPQRPYLSMGTLRDQVIYPHTHQDMLAAGVTDDDLMKILEVVHLEYIPGREHGWDAKKEWKDVLSGGEKQRMNLARLFYHKPKFAFLDECTSAVSHDVEGIMYQRAKDMGITLITISHRPSLFKHHKYLLQFTGDNRQWEWSEIGSKKAKMSVEAELRDLEKKIRDEPKLRQRIAEINNLLGVNAGSSKK